MSDRKPLFPARPGEDVVTAPPPPSSSPPIPPPAPTIDTDMAARIERAVIDVFMRRFNSERLPYAQARVLVTLELEVVGVLVRELATTAAAPRP
jgi:hypothetical protein